MSKFWSCFLTITHLLRQVAIKSIRKDRIVEDLDRIHIQREIEITASLRHANIIRFHEGRSHTHSHKKKAIRNPPVSRNIKTKSQIYLDLQIGPRISLVDVTFFTPNVERLM